MSQPQGPPPAYQAPPGQHPGYPPQPQPGYGAPPPQMASQQSSNVVVVNQPQQQSVVVGGCPACGVGHVSDNFTVLGIILAICFFPLGVLCCFLLMEKRCDRCGASF